jgi:hypothetical protein
VRTLSRAIESRLVALFKCASPDAEELGPVLEEVAAVSTTHFIVIDAIDECEKADRDILLNVLLKVINSSQTRIRIFLASRESIGREIDQRFKPYHYRTMNSPEAQEDIETYIKDAVREKIKIGALMVGQKELELDIQNALINNAQGMYVHRKRIFKYK